MAKKVLYTDFEDAASIIENMMSSKDFKKAVTRNNLYKFWDKVVPKQFIGKSKPYSMTANSVMVIACQSSTLAQEILFFKAKILKDFQPYLKSLHLTVKDLKFDPKKWEGVNSEE